MLASDLLPILLPKRAFASRPPQHAAGIVRSAKLSIAEMSEGSCFEVGFKCYEGFLLLGLLVAALPND